MSIYFTSDTHFYHKNIIRFQPNTRGMFRSVEEMNAALISRWNDRVKRGDTVYHLGDFAFTTQKNIRNILSLLNGNIYLITGNHDKVFGSEGLRSNLIKEDLISGFYNTYHEVTINQTLYVLNHYAQRVWNKSHYGSIHLYGHSHGSLPGLGLSVDVGVDSIEMGEFTGLTLCPWSIDDIIKFMETKSMHEIDRHKIKMRE